MNVRFWVLLLWIVLPSQSWTHTHNSAFSDRPPAVKSQILYLMHTGEIDHALQKYEEYRTQLKADDDELIQQIALTLLEHGSRSKDEEEQLMTIFGAGISTHERAIPILERGLESKNPQLQMISLNFLGRQNSDEADAAINTALASPYALIRLEAVYYLCKKKDATAVSQAEALMHKVQPELKPIFPLLFATEGGPNSIKILRKMMSDPNDLVRVAAVLSAVDSKRDDLLPKIRQMAAHHNPSHQEACAFAIGELHDHHSVERLKELTESSSPFVEIAAHDALYKLGHREYAGYLLKAARQGDVFAITVLGHVEGAQDLLLELAQSNNLQVKINAILALLEHSDKRVLKLLPEILIRDARDLGFSKINSAGKALTAWKVVPSSSHNFQDNPVLWEMSITMREEVLDEALELPDNLFIPLANLILETQQNDLIPHTIELLENLQSPEAIELLKKHQQKVGAPLIRAYCTLALFRMKVPGPYKQQLRDWVAAQEKVELIKFRPFVPIELREREVNPYELTPEETSRIYVEAIEAIAANQDENGIRILLHMIRYGNTKNRYALAGLLLRAIQ